MPSEHNTGLLEVIAEVSMDAGVMFQFVCLNELKEKQKNPDSATFHASVFIYMRLLMFYNLFLTHQRVPEIFPTNLVMTVINVMERKSEHGASKALLSLLWYQQGGDWEETLQTLPASTSLE